MPARPFRIEHFAENTHDYLRQHKLEDANIFGYSMGGYVACVLAKTNPKLVSSIVTLGTKFYWDREVAEHEMRFVDIEKIKAKVPQFAQSLKERHTGAGWENVVNYTREMLHNLGERGGAISADDLASLDQRIKIMIGDRDTTVTFDESISSYRALKHGAFEVLPATPHPLEKVSMARLAFGLREFFCYNP